MRPLRPAASVLTVAMLLTACGSSDNEPAAAPTTDAAVATEPPTTEAAEPEAVEAEPEPEADAPPATEPAESEPAESGGEENEAEADAGVNAADEDGTDADAGESGDAAALDFSTIGPAVQGFIDDNDLSGAGLVIVERDAGVVHEEYWNDFTADRVSYIASSSKTLTAGVILKLDQDGVLDIDATVADTVEWGAGNPDVTIAQLVSNTSGLVGLGPDPLYAPYLCQFMPDREMEECAAEIFNTAGDDADVLAPDTEYRYGGAQWQVAGAVAEATSGKSWAELIDETYVQPCGVDSLGFNNHWIFAGGFDYPTELDPAELEPTENPQMEGGAFINAPDYAELVLMQLRGGECPGGSVLTPESIEAFHMDRVGPDGAGDADTGYGFGWWHERDTGYLTDTGAYGSVAFLDPATGIGGYLVIEADGGTGNQLEQLIRPLMYQGFGR